MEQKTNQKEIRTKHLCTICGEDYKKLPMRCLMCGSKSFMKITCEEIK